MEISLKYSGCPGALADVAEAGIASTGMAESFLSASNTTRTRQMLHHAVSTKLSIQQVMITMQRHINMPMKVSILKTGVRACKVQFHF